MCASSSVNKNLPSNSHGITFSQTSQKDYVFNLGSIGDFAKVVSPGDETVEDMFEVYGGKLKW